MNRVLAGFLAILSAAPAVAGWGGKAWDDGRAEVAVYDSERMIDGQPRMFREELVLVKEDLRLDTLVKANRPKETKTLRVFTLNQVQSVDAGNHPHHYLTTVFANADNPATVVKISVGAQDASGNTFKLFAAPPEGPRTLLWHSYFDGEADQSVSLPTETGDMFDDGLPLALRALPLKEGFRLKTRLWDNLTNSHGKVPAVVPAEISVLEEETVRCYAGSIPSWKVAVVREGGSTDIYWLEKAEPRVLVRLEAADGRKKLLHGRSRWAYWDRRLPRPNVLK